MAVLKGQLLLEVGWGCSLQSRGVEGERGSEAAVLLCILLANILLHSFPLLCLLQRPNLSPAIVCSVQLGHGERNAIHPAIHPVGTWCCPTAPPTLLQHTHPLPYCPRCALGKCEP